MAGKFGVDNLSEKWKKGDLPMNPFVRVILNEALHCINGTIGISATLATDNEIDFEIDKLHKNLELVRKEAKLVLKKQRDKIHSSYK
jgi:hypothetical protein